MSKRLQLYLDDRSLSAVRATDSIAGRFNQIADRYLEMIARDRENVRGKFTAGEWSQLIDLAERFDDRERSASARLSALLAFAGNRALRRVLHGLTGGELVVLLELLENEQRGEPPGYAIRSEARS